jgi:hypothetical protein
VIHTWSWESFFVGVIVGEFLGAFFYRLGQKHAARKDL